MSEQQTNQPTAPLQRLNPDVMTPELVDRMLSNQAQELSLRASELQLQQQKDTNAFAFGKEALAAQAKDRTEQRAHAAHVRRCTYWFSGLIILLVTLLLAYALHTNNSAFATEVVKAIVYVLTGGAGGYGLAAAQHRKQPSKHSSNG